MDEQKLNRHFPICYTRNDQIKQKINGDIPTGKCHISCNTRHEKLIITNPEELKISISLLAYSGQPVGSVRCDNWWNINDVLNKSFQHTCIHKHTPIHFHFELVKICVILQRKQTQDSNQFKPNGMQHFTYTIFYFNIIISSHNKIHTNSSLSPIARTTK